MTISAEERARSVVRSLLEPLDNGKPYLETPMRKVMVEVIASAIREAEDAALERAAVAISWLVISEDYACDEAERAVRDVRSLKHHKD